jgi:lysophospholipase L1-like esterase
MKYLIPFLLSIQLLLAVDISRSVTYDSVTKTVAPSNLVLIAPLTATVPTTGNSVVNRDALDAGVAAGTSTKLDITNGVAYQSLSLIPANVTARTNIVRVAPYQSATYAAGDFGPTAGETSYEFLNTGNAQRLRQSGTITQVKASIASVTGVAGLYAKVWRKVAANNYRLVGTSENLLSQVSAGSVNTLALATGITSQVGDYIGLRVTYSSASVQLFNSEAPISTASTIYTVSNATPDQTAYAWESQTATAGTCVVVEAYMVAPILVGIGDSVMSGSGTSTSLIQTNTTYVEGLDFPARISTATSWSAQNMGIGSDRLTSNIINRFTNDLINLAPRIALLEGGVNDLRDSVSVASIMATYQLMLSNCVTAGITPVVMGVMPFRTFFDATSAMSTNRDALNILLRVAAVAAGGYYVDPDPYIGAFWGGGPENNRWLLARDADSGDGLHLSSAGQAAIVRAVFDAMAPLRIRGGIEAGYVTAGGINTKGPILFDTSVPHLISGRRQTNYAAAAQSLTVQAQGAPQNATNAAGGDLVLQPGTSTGSGRGTVYIKTPTPGSSGTNDTSLATRATVDDLGLAVATANNSFGASASRDTRFGIYYRDSVGTSTDSIGVYALPTISTTASGQAASVAGTFIVTGNVSKAAGIYAPSPVESGAGVLTNFYGVAISSTEVADSTVALYIGSGFPSSSPGNYAIYSASARPSYLANNLTVAGVFSGGNKSSFGATAASDARFGIYYRDTIGDGTTAVGIYSVPTLAVNQSSVAASFQAGTIIAGTISQANGFYAPPPTVSSGAVTNWSSFFADTTPTATYQSGITLSRGRPSTLTRSYSIRSLETNQSYFAGPLFVEANNVSIGAYSSPDDLRFGVYFRGPVGSGIDASGIYSLPYVSANQTARSAGVTATIQAAATLNRAAAFRAQTPTISSGAITNWFGVSIDTTSTSTRTAGLFLGDGLEPALSQDWAIYSTSTKSSSFAGSVSATTFSSTVATGTAPLTVASTTLVSNLNADRLDGLHKGGIQPASANLTNVAALTAQSLPSTIISVTENTQTGTTYTVLSADNGKVVTLNNGSAITVTVPTLSAGFTCTFIQKGAGQVTFSASGTTVSNAHSQTKTFGQYAVVTIYGLSSTAFVLAGDTGT